MIIENGEKVTAPQENRIYGEFEYNNSKVIFKGKGNILYTDGTVVLTDSTLSFFGDNAVIFLSGNSSRDYKLTLDVWRETAVFFGADNYFNRPMNAIISERKNLIVGANGTFSFGLWLRTADPHLIYSAEKHRRINPSKSILIGDHVWLGQNATILKGSRIGSGSIISANCVIAGKEIGSNTIYAGNPGRMIKSGIFFLKNNTHNFSAKKTKSFDEYPGDDYLYENDGRQITLSSIDKALEKAKTADDKLAVIKSMLAEKADHNRFYIAPEVQKKGLLQNLRGLK